MHLSPRYRRLMRDGSEAQAVVIESEAVPGSRGGIRGYKLTLRVQFEDGTTTETERTARTIDIGGSTVNEGTIVPVRYDPDDRSRIEIDGPALNARTEAAKAEATQRNIQDADAQLARKRRGPA